MTNIQNELLESIDAKLGVIVGLLERNIGEVAQESKHPSQLVAEKVLADSNEVVKELVAAAPEVPETTNDEDFAIGDRVLYVGKRSGFTEGTITEIKDRSPWITVLFDNNGSPVSCRKGELTKKTVDQPPALDYKEEEQVENLLEQEAEGPQPTIKIDEEAAEYKIDKGSFKEYRNIHAIYTDMKKAEPNRKYLRFRASKAIGGDEVTKEMCHRYLVSVQDEVYMLGVDA